MKCSVGGGSYVPLAEYRNWRQLLLTNVPTYVLLRFCNNAGNTYILSLFIILVKLLNCQADCCKVILCVRCQSFISVRFPRKKQTNWLAGSAPRMVVDDDQPSLSEQIRRPPLLTGCESHLVYFPCRVAVK